MTGLPVDVDIVAIPVGQEVTTITVHTEGTVNFNIADYRNGLVTVSLDNCDTSMIYSWVQFSASWEVSDQQGKTTTRVVYKNKVKLFVSKTERFTFPLPLDAAKLSACLITFSDLPQSVTSWTIADIISMFPQQNNSSSQNGNNQGNGTTINDNKTQNNSNGNNTDAKIEVVSHLPTVALALIISGAVFALLFCCIAYCLVRRYRRKRK